jgi:hypothetical protein
VHSLCHSIIKLSEEGFGILKILRVEALDEAAIDGLKQIKPRGTFA